MVAMATVVEMVAVVEVVGCTTHRHHNVHLTPPRTLGRNEPRDLQYRRGGVGHDADSPSFSDHGQQRGRAAARARVEVGCQGHVDFEDLLARIELSMRSGFDGEFGGVSWSRSSA